MGRPKRRKQKIFETFVDAGGNFIDTANRYTNGTSEKFVGDFIAGDRDRFVIATKYSLNMRKGDPNAGGNHRKSLIQSLNASLERLGTKYIDLYWVHAWDAITPMDEVMRALDDMVKSGKVLHVGISDTPAWVISRANAIAESRGWSPFIGLQIEYSLVQRTPERELLPMARALDIGVTAWSPLARGILTGKYLSQNKQEVEQARLTQTGITPNERFMKIAEVVQEVSKEGDYSAAQVALNWLRQQEGTIIPILERAKHCSSKIIWAQLILNCRKSN